MELTKGATRAVGKQQQPASRKFGPRPRAGRLRPSAPCRPPDALEPAMFIGPSCTVNARTRATSSLLALAMLWRAQRPAVDL